MLDMISGLAGCQGKTAKCTREGSSSRGYLRVPEMATPASLHEMPEKGKTGYQLASRTHFNQFSGNFLASHRKCSHPEAKQV